MYLHQWILPRRKHILWCKTPKQLHKHPADSSAMCSAHYSSSHIRLQPSQNPLASRTPTWQQRGGKICRPQSQLRQIANQRSQRCISGDLQYLDLRMKMPRDWLGMFHMCLGTLAWWTGGRLGSDCEDRRVLPREVVDMKFKVCQGLCVFCVMMMLSGSWVCYLARMDGS